MSGVSTTVIVSLLLLAPAMDSLAFESSYDCLQVASTDVGWDVDTKSFTTGCDNRPEHPITVKLSRLDTEQPLIMGQNVSKLEILAKEPDAIWLAERAPWGNVIQWTLFERVRNASLPVTLISTKSYPSLLSGRPYSFTTVYACRSNMPLSN